MECSHWQCRDAPVSMEASRFRGADGVEEIHLMARPAEYGSFDIQLDWLQHGCRESLDTLGVDRRSAVLRRFFCSDLPNQAGTLAEHPFCNPRHGEDPCAVSCVGQPVPGPAKVALWAYHINDPRGPIERKLDGNTLTLRREQLQHHWTCGITSPTCAGAFDQTTAVFAAYEALLRAHGLALSEHVIRTWVFMPDIDADYREMAEARRQYFARRGLTPQTHYIASTGIQGACLAPTTRVALDAHAVSGVRAEQIEFINAPDHLSPTHEYGVTFERATALRYRDRKHVLISGTASIDAHGEILYPGNVSRQLRRTLDNIEALLAAASAAREHMCMLIAYLRDASDEQVVRSGIRDRFGDVPLAVVRAPVCRPAWLVEVEGQAILPTSNPELPPF